MHIPFRAINILINVQVLSSYHGTQTLVFSRIITKPARFRIIIICSLLHRYYVLCNDYMISKILDMCSIIGIELFVKVVSDVSNEGNCGWFRIFKSYLDSEADWTCFGRMYDMWTEYRVLDRAYNLHSY